MDHTLVSSPWVEHFQLGSARAGSLQPPSTPLDHYRQARALFALGLKNELRLLFCHPLGKGFQPTEALMRLSGFPTRAIIRQNASGLAPISDFPRLAEGCQLALLWAILGEKQAAEKLAAILLPLLTTRLLTIWSIESEYNELETRRSAALLLRALGREKEAIDLLPNAPCQDPFFTYLMQQNVQIGAVEPLFSDPDYGYQFHQSRQAVFASTLSGKNNGAGLCRIGSLQIPAFGPQGAPLSDAAQFGIERGENGWFCTKANKETWCHLQATCSDKSIQLDWQTIGSNQDKPIALSFYIIADVCRIEGRTFKPKSLQRFSGLIKRAEFGPHSIETDHPVKAELIPLAGEGCFWGASFLLAFWLPLSGLTVIRLQN
jgi:hypothetical protein